MPISVKVASIRVSKSDFNTRLLTFSRKSKASRVKFRILTIWCRLRPVVPTYPHMNYIRNKLLTATTSNYFNLKKIGTKLLYNAPNKTFETLRQTDNLAPFWAVFCTISSAPCHLASLYANDIIFGTQPLNNNNFIVLKFLSKRIISTPTSLRFMTKNFFFGHNFRMCLNLWKLPKASLCTQEEGRKHGSQRLSQV